MTLPNRDLILLAQFFFNNRVCYNLPRKKHVGWFQEVGLLLFYISGCFSSSDLNDVAVFL